MKYKIELTIDELNLCVAGLQKLPYETVIRLLQNLTDQYKKIEESTDCLTPQSECDENCAPKRGRKKKTDSQDNGLQSD